ncbi:diacylglycerol/lipid kinase family protein [Nisaea sp.]|uniref:diacylglycerol/lipid kinase family protein n=1 Tax=Nisaea sp. TaxID=2024842 RepID=UPI003B5163C5
MDQFTGESGGLLAGAIQRPVPAGDRRHVVVIYNPKAGQRRYPLFSSVIAGLKARGVAATILETGARGDAEAFARHARQHSLMHTDDAPDAVVAAGGDGTINEVVNGMSGGDLPLAILPLGTANVLAAEIGLAVSPETIAETIWRGPAISVRLGDVNGHRFSLMAGVGLDADVVASVDGKVKAWLGKGAYVLTTLHQLATYRPHYYRVAIDRDTYRAASVVVAKAHYYGGTFVCAPDARLDEDMLHVCLFERAGRWNAIRYAGNMMAGRLPRAAGYRIIQTRSVSIWAEEGAYSGDPVQADGDIVTNLPASISLPSAPLRLVVPGPRP